MTDNQTGEILADYMRRVDSGEQVDVNAICEAHPEIADEIRAYIDGAALVQNLLRPGDTSKLDAYRDTVRPSQSHDTDADLIGHLFDRYRIEKQLGEGAMGAVYLAVDTQLDREVALKIPKVRDGEQNDFLARFRWEAQAAAKLDHPGICSVFDFGESSRRPYITMAYINGLPLSHFVGTNELDQKKIIEIVREIADALQHAHQMGVIHRDLKSGNVMINHQGKPIVTDFGLARKADQTEESRLTLEGALVGTPGYMAPEQVEAESDQIGPATDIYSLGVILYELLTGDLPFRGSIHSILAQITRDKPRNPLNINPHADARLCELCLQMLAKKPENRPQSMQEVADQLDQYAAEPTPEQIAKQDDKTRRLEKLESAKQKVTDLVRRGQYAQAVSLLEKMSATTDPDAIGYASWAREELNRVRKLPQKVRDGVPALVGTARKFMQKYDYGQAAEILQQIPQEMRSPSVEKLLNKAIDLQDEADMLLKDLRECVRSREFQGIDDNVQRLLEIKPNNRFARDLSHALKSYQHVSVDRREYVFGQTGELLPLEEAKTFSTLLLMVLTVLIGFGGLFYGITLLIDVGDVTLLVETDDELLKNGDLTLTFDGETHHINGPEFKISVAPGEYGYEVRQGDTLIRNPEKFTVVKKGQNVLTIQPWPSLVDRSSTSVPKASSANEQPDFAEVHGASKSQLQAWLKSIRGEYIPLHINLRWGASDLIFDATAEADSTGNNWVVNFFENSSESLEFSSKYRWSHALYWRLLFPTAGVPPQEGPGLRIRREDSETTYNPRDIHDQEFQEAVDFYERRKWFPMSLCTTESAGQEHNFFLGHQRFDVEHQSFVGLTLEEFRKKNAEFEDKNWRLHFFQLQSGTSTLKFNCTFCEDKNAFTTETSFDLSEDQYESLLEQRRLSVWRPHCVGSYLDNGTVKYVVNWQRRADQTEVPDQTMALPVEHVAADTRSHWRHLPIDAPRPAIAPFDPQNASELQQQWAEYLDVPVEFTDKFGFTFSLIPPGEFDMGTSQAELDELMVHGESGGEYWKTCLISESPQHRVALTKPFYLSTKEVTQGQFESIMSFNPSYYASENNEELAETSTLNFPVEGVTWNQTQEFIEALLSDLGDFRKASDQPFYRLPSEAEWEFACRGGASTRFWTGDDEQVLSEKENFGNRHGGILDVASLSPNPFGLYDMSGNVHEFVEDRWDSKHPTEAESPISVNPTGATSTDLTSRVVRGGDFWWWHYHSRASYRISCEQDVQSGMTIGFRLAGNVEAYKMVESSSAVASEK